MLNTSNFKVFLANFKAFSDMLVTLNVECAHVFQQEWNEILQSCEGEFDEDAKYGILDGSENVKKEKNQDAMECLVGSYRKLDVD